MIEFNAITIVNNKCYTTILGLIQLYMYNYEHNMMTKSLSIMPAL